MPRSTQAIVPLACIVCLTLLGMTALLCAVWLYANGSRNANGLIAVAGTCAGAMSMCLGQFVSNGRSLPHFPTKQPPR